MILFSSDGAVLKVNCVDEPSPVNCSLVIVAVPDAPLPEVVNVTNDDPSVEPSKFPVVVLNLISPCVVVDLSPVVPLGSIIPSV